MKLNLLLPLSLVFHHAAAAAIPALADADRASIAADAKDKFKSRIQTYEKTMVDMTPDDEKMSRIGDKSLSSCETQAELYYDNTSISNADFIFLLILGAFTDPYFDWRGYIDYTINIDYECANIGGEIYEMDLSFDCGAYGASHVEGFKFCKPPLPHCHEFEFVLYKHILYPLYGAYLGCDIEVLSDAAPSLDCFDGIDEIYNNSTALSDAAPETFIASGGTQYIEVSSSS